MKLLIVEDDVGLARLIRAILVDEGYEVDHVTSGTEGRDRALLGSYHGILLDLGLEDRHGLQVLDDLRRRGVTTPVLILTAESSEAVIVQALDTGADEYVVKPIRHQELAARVRALLRRGERSSSPDTLSAGGLVLHRLKRRATMDGAAIDFSPREFSLLECLLENADTVLSRSELLALVWNMSFDPGSNVIDVHVTRVRRKLARVGAPVAIHTERGVGFRLERLVP